MATTRKFTVPVGEIEVSEYDGFTLFLSERIGTFEHEGWKGEIETTGHFLIVRLNKGEEHIVQSIELSHVITPWIEAAVKELT